MTSLALIEIFSKQGWINSCVYVCSLRANKKFTKRFKKMEEIAEKPLEDLSYEEYDADEQYVGVLLLQPHATRRDIPH